MRQGHVSATRQRAWRVRAVAGKMARRALSKVGPESLGADENRQKCAASGQKHRLESFKIKGQGEFTHGPLMVMRLGEL